MDLSELLEDSNKDLVIIYPGRFHPFHIGHGKVYQYLKINYPNAQVFISTSDNTDGDRSPFTFEEKKKMMILAGVDSGAIVQCKSPYQSVEITERFDENKTVVVFAVSEKDMAEEPRFDFSDGIKLKKNGEPAYMQKWNDLDSAETFSKHGYLATTPTFKFEVRMAKGKKTRIKYLEGVGMEKKNRSINSSFTVRKISFGEGVERTFALYSPILDSIKVTRSGQVKRAKLYYLRDRKGKSARISEKIKKKIGVDVSEQAAESKIIKEELKQENLIKDKDIATNTEPKKEKLKTEKK